LTTYWPSDQQWSYLNPQLPRHSWNVRTDKETLPGGSSMDMDAYLDNSYDYSRSMSANYDETLIQYLTDIITLADSPSTPSTNDLPMQVNDQSTLFPESFT
jgi:hypothetical protein